MEVKKILIISGPTASGKTSLSLDVAKSNDGEIVNFDSLLFYKGLNIGTAKPNKNEMDGVAHHLIDLTTPSTPLNAARYCELALPIIDEIHSKGKTPILVGGSGFYLRALIKGMYPTISPSIDTTQRSNLLYEEQGITPFWNELKKCDPISYEKLHINDHYRIRRAIEFFWTSNYPISDAPKKQSQFTPRYIEKQWNITHCYLNIPTEAHYPIIKSRSQLMLESGLIDEVKDLLNQGFTGQENPLQSIGYKETVAFINGEIKSEDDLIEAIFISTRQLAKSQRTWFNSVENKSEFNPLTQYKDALDYCRSAL